MIRSLGTSEGLVTSKGFLWTNTRADSPSGFMIKPGVSRCGCEGVFHNVPRDTPIVDPEAEAKLGVPRDFEYVFWCVLCVILTDAAALGI